MTTEFTPLDIVEILKILPHRYPFVMVDKVLDMRNGEWIKGIKNVTINENFFQGHFPAKPIMPGVLIIEALAQLGAIMAYLSVGNEARSKLVYFAGIDKVRFRQKVEPGDQLILEATTIKQKLGMWNMSCTAHVNDKLAVEAKLMATLR